MTRDQQRAVYAYQRVSQVQSSQQGDYEILVKGLGANIIRSGLAVAVCHLERETKKRPAAQQLLQDLQETHWPVARPQGTTFAAHIRTLSLDNYILMTQEMLQVVPWFKRAVESTFPNS